MTTKLIYALVIDQQPGTYSFNNPLSDKSFTWQPNEDGFTIFYIGETSMSLAERKSKHKTFAKKFALYMNDQPVLDPHLYPVYAFMHAFDPDLTFRIMLLQEGEGKPEADFVLQAKDEGHPLQNKLNGSKSLIRNASSATSAFKTLNKEYFQPKAKAPEPTPEEVMLARQKWIEENKRK